MNTEKPREVVIIGGVAGGMSAATRLRRLDEDAKITILEKGQHVSFANCGLPYYAGGVIEERDSLLLQTPESLKSRFNLDVLVNHEAVAIDRQAQSVLAQTPEGTKTFHYDQLILAPGARPFVPPMPGIERALTLRNVSDVDAMVEAIETKPETAAILGGGFIGLELAENLHARGIDVTIVEAAPHILAPLDEEMAAIVENHLIDQGVKIITNDQAVEVSETDVVLKSGRQVPAQLVVAAVGVRPESGIAQQAGIETDQRGGIIVDAQQRTSDPNIFAVGDAVVKRDRIDGSPVHIPLANSANRDGRTVADIIVGLDSPFEGAERRETAGVLGTAVVGVMGLTVAATGWNERKARAAGKEVAVIHTHPFNHATYYPGAEKLALKLVYDPQSLKILGAQAIGGSGADKRIDVIATAIAGGLTAPDLAGIDLAYAPQFGSAKDPVTMLGFVADNIATGLTKSVDVKDLPECMDSGQAVLDVRTEAEFRRGNIPGAINIPLDDLRGRIDEVRQLAEGKEVIVHCAVGVRGHTAVQILQANGIDAANLDGGYTSWSALQRKRERES
ncbi:CoA-disulfide reductase [Boudabousia liubingyangii]|uniref:CoA-disulfide reductase n=1 Tax=Boudabousia liubingyangii TaxID=1921764 RepID=A0A1Q5PLG9_9ACTO|nr:FAD-dependent oxidoreductase [Boudabousia liubingyangii]OKL47898.1 CoA-disulfide reductase [Boudabousia liubingyangii]